MTFFLWFFFMENLTESEFVPMMTLVAVVVSVTNGLIWNIGVPALFIKAVSDAVSGGAEQFEEMIEKAAEVCVKIVMKIAEGI